jgi:hypothetical protein
MRRSVLPAVVAVAAVALLAACAPAAKPHATVTATKKPVATASASATPTASPLPDGVLFQITATATAPDGTAATLTETVQAPTATTTLQNGDTAQLDNECDGWRQAFTNTQFLVAKVTTSIPGGASWTADDGRIAVDMAGYPVWSGDQQPFQALCASAIAGIPGSARAVSPVAGGKPDATGGWAVFRYGFSNATVGDASSSSTASPSADQVVFSRCKLQLGAAASPSIFASTWAAHPDTEGGAACRFGGTGSN